MWNLFTNLISNLRVHGSKEGGKGGVGKVQKSLQVFHTFVRRRVDAEDDALCVHCGCHCAASGPAALIHKLHAVVVGLPGS